MFVTQKISTGEMKDKIEQQLRLQREANNKKRAEDLKQGEIKVIASVSSILTLFFFISRATTIQDDNPQDGDSQS